MISSVFDEKTSSLNKFRQIRVSFLIYLVFLPVRLGPRLGISPPPGRFFLPALPSSKKAPANRSGEVIAREVLINHASLGTPRGRFEKHSSKFSLS